MNSSNKIVLFGDSGVGKSTLVSMLCGAPNSRPQSTIGCAIQIMAHQYAAGTPQQSLELIELWDVGGSNAHREACSVYFESVSGVIYVHDLSNSKSEENLAQWSDSFNNYRCLQGNQSMNRLSSDFSSPFCDVEKMGLIPTLVVDSMQAVDGVNCQKLLDAVKHNLLGVCQTVEKDNFAEVHAKLTALKSSLDQMRENINNIPDLDRNTEGQQEKARDLRRQYEMKRSFIEKFKEEPPEGRLFPDLAMQP